MSSYPINLLRQTPNQLSLSRGNPSTTFPSPVGSINIYFPFAGNPLHLLSAWLMQVRFGCLVQLLPGTCYYTQGLCIDVRELRLKRAKKWVMKRVYICVLMV